MAALERAFLVFFYGFHHKYVENKSELQDHLDIDAIEGWVDDVVFWGVLCAGVFNVCAIGGSLRLFFNMKRKGIAGKII